jgi:hypothetical protein
MPVRAKLGRFGVGAIVTHVRPPCSRPFTATPYVQIGVGDVFQLPHNAFPRVLASVNSDYFGSHFEFLFLSHL